MEGGERNKQQPLRAKPPPASPPSDIEVIDPAIIPGQEQGKESSAAAAGVGRVYECTFCRGGFTTAQALGGHMNIHRRDRAMMRLMISESQLSALSAAGEASSSSSSHHSPAVAHPTFPAAAAAGHYFSSPSSPSSHHREAWPPSARASEESSLSRCNEDSNAEEKDEKEEEMDLELRLGHGHR